MTRTRAAIDAEWTKLWTTRTVWWALAAAMLLMFAGAGQYAIYADNGDIPELFRGDTIPAGIIAVQAVGFAQLAFAALAMLVTTSEHSTGTIRATLTWIPSRGRLLLAKCTVVLAVTLVAGVLAGVLGAVTAAPILGAVGDASAGGIARDAMRIGAYLGPLAVIATGLGAALRGPVLTLVVILMLFVVVPPLLQVPDVAVLNGIADSMPGVAGQHFMLGDTDPYPPVAGLVILTAWAVAAVLAGWQVMRRHDA